VAHGYDNEVVVTGCCATARLIKVLVEAQAKWRTAEIFGVPPKKA
jgi:hypothetical protein